MYVFYSDDVLFACPKTHVILILHCKYFQFLPSWRLCTFYAKHIADITIKFFRGTMGSLTL